MPVADVAPRIYAPGMAEIVVEPATADRWDDAARALTGGGDGGSCWCQWWRYPNAEFRTMSVDEKRELLRSELAESSPAPALIASVDGEAAGWVRVGPRWDQARLIRSIAVKQGTSEPLDARDVWAISCLVVRREHRGAGLMSVLVDAAVAHARAAGARVVEAYPVDTAGTRGSSNELYHGVASVFAAAGFEVVSRPKPQRPVMALAL